MYLISWTFQYVYVTIRNFIIGTSRAKIHFVYTQSVPSAQVQEIFQLRCFQWKVSRQHDLILSSCGADHWENAEKTSDSVKNLNRLSYQLYHNFISLVISASRCSKWRPALTTHNLAHVATELPAFPILPRSVCMRTLHCTVSAVVPEARSLKCNIMYSQWLEYH
jgi:hypothetical protein